jgi:hypothetical protein
LDGCFLIMFFMIFCLFCFYKIHNLFLIHINYSSNKNIFRNFWDTNTYIWSQKNIFCQLSRTSVKLQFPCQKLENITPDIMIKMISTSAILALLFTVPALGLFLGIYWYTDNLLISAIVGFAIHFLTLGLSYPISQFISAFFDG